MDVTVGIVAQRDNDRATALAKTLITTLEGQSQHVTVTLDAETAGRLGRAGVSVTAMADTDLVVSIGGDGTFLFVAREAATAPVVGVNLGEVGFLNAVAPTDAVRAVSELTETLVAGETLETREVNRLHATGDGWTLEPALNEIVVHGPRRGPAGGVELEVHVDDECYTHSRGDGVLVATPTGSTAYNLSEGGPLIRPGLDVLVLTQMCATESMPPLVVGSEDPLEITLSGADHGYTIADGRNRQQLELPTTVEISLADQPLSLAGPSVNFFRALEKLQ